MEQIGNTVSVITVVHNDIAHIRETMESFFAQTWADKELIVVDGGSTDGTADVVAEYSDRLAWWCSEPDGGMYDAMNKGIAHAKGHWINILNSGDTYTTPVALEQLATANNDADIRYGNSIEITNEHEIAVEAGSDPSLMELTPIYRHGSSIVKTELQRKHLYDVTRKEELGYSLDWLCIFTMYKQGAKFCKTDCYVQSYRRNGTSNHALKSIWYIYKITSQGKFAPRQKMFAVKNIVKSTISNTSLYRWITALALDYVPNSILPHVPFWCLRKWYFKFIGMKIGKKSFVMRHNYIITPNRLKIGNYSHINRGCLIDCRGKVNIGSNVSISHNVNIVTGGHDMDSQTFMGKYLPIEIGDYAWLGIGCTILQGVKVGHGAVVCAGAVVTSDVEPFTVVGGIPARMIRKRRENLDYHCIWNAPLT